MEVFRSLSLNLGLCKKNEKKNKELNDEDKLKLLLNTALYHTLTEKSTYLENMATLLRTQTISAIILIHNTPDTLADELKLIFRMFNNLCKLHAWSVCNSFTHLSPDLRLTLSNVIEQVETRTSRKDKLNELNYSLLNIKEKYICLSEYNAKCYPIQRRNILRYVQRQSLNSRWVLSACNIKEMQRQILLQQTKYYKKHFSFLF
uniref:Uncharacterized protein n=1 Tax=Glossina austeni TaxID=7395 RepID=A0A1A9UXK7_GLOAU